MMILAGGLSPAWQQILVFDEVAVGGVNRAAQAVWCASGKVLNVARAVWSLGAEVEAVCPVGGLAGEAIRREFDVDRIPARWITTASPTRVCTTVIERASCRVTEFIENAAPITPDELAAFESAYAAAARNTQLSILTGSLPSVIGHGKPVDLYRRLMVDGPPVILDVRGAELAEALKERPLLVKPNREELAATVGRALSDDEAVLAAMRAMNDAGAQWVLISSGPRDVMLSSRTSAWRLTPPKVDVVNPIGCGDCLAAGIAVATAEGAEMVDAVRFGMAAAADNLGQLLPARLNRTRVERLARWIQAGPL